MEITLIDDPVYLTESLVSRLKELGSIKVYFDKPSKETAVQRINQSNVAIIRWTSITRDSIEKIDPTCYIILAGTGFPKIDIEAAREKGIKVSNIPDYCRFSVAEHVFMLILSLNRHIINAYQYASNGKPNPDPILLGTELNQKTLGVIGVGQIGSAVATIGLGFGMRVLGNTRTKKNITGVINTDLDTLLAESDIVSVNVDLNPSTQGLLNKDKLLRMKKNSLLICTTNTSVIDEDALVEMLKDKRLAGAGIDSACKNKELRLLDNVLLTPGSAWYTQEALRRLEETIVINIRSFTNGTFINLI